MFYNSDYLYEVDAIENFFLPPFNIMYIGVARNITWSCFIPRVTIQIDHCKH